MYQSIPQSTEKVCSVASIVTESQDSPEACMQNTLPQRMRSAKDITHGSNQMAAEY